MSCIFLDYYGDIKILVEDMRWDVCRIIDHFSKNFVLDPLHFNDVCPTFNHCRIRMNIFILYNFVEFESHVLKAQ